MTPADLKALYPNQFTGRDARWLGFHGGWMPVISAMCEEVETVMRWRQDRYAFRWAQFKERLGVPYFSYYSLCVLDERAEGSPDAVDVRRRLEDIVVWAEERARGVCFICGHPATPVGAPWTHTLCQEHAQIHRVREPLYVFLDFDGVTHPVSSPKDQQLCQLPLIEEVLQEHPQARIVISSSWPDRYPLDALRERFRPQLCERVVGRQPCLNRLSREEFEEEHLLGISEFYRQAEIEAWLYLNRQARDVPWLAIDDSTLGFERRCPNLLLTDRHAGFTEADAQRLHELLQRANAEDLP